MSDGHSGFGTRGIFSPRTWIRIRWLIIHVIRYPKGALWPYEIALVDIRDDLTCRARVDYADDWIHLSLLR